MTTAIFHRRAAQGHERASRRKHLYIFSLWRRREQETGLDAHGSF